MPMILTCEKCQTRFSLDPAALGREGRKVKCTRCGETWFQTPPQPGPDAPLRAPAEPRQAGSATGPDGAREAGSGDGGDAGPEAPPRPKGRRATAARGGPGGDRRGNAAGWMLLTLIVVGLGAALYLGRDAVVNAWPPAWRLYATLGLDEPALQDEGAVAPYVGLSFVDVVPRWAETEGAPVLMVSGGLVNGGTGLARIPLFEARFLDAAGDTLDIRPVDPGFARLDAGETQLFEMALAEPHPGTHRVELVFATGTALSGSGS